MTEIGNPLLRLLKATCVRLLIKIPSLLRIATDAHNAPCG